MKKHFLTSKTFQGVIVTVLGLLVQNLGWGITEAEVAEIAGWIVSGLGLAWTVYGRARTNGEKLALGKGRGTAVLGLLLAVSVVLAGGCAVKNIADMPAPEKARAVADLVMDQFLDLRQAYTEAAPSMEPDTRAKATRLLNRTKPAVVALADAALAWSEATAGDYDQALADALDLLAQARTFIPDKE